MPREPKTTEAPQGVDEGAGSGAPAGDSADGGGGPGPLSGDELTPELLALGFQLSAHQLAQSSVLVYGVEAVIVRGERFEIDMIDGWQHNIPLRVRDGYSYFRHGGRWYWAHSQHIDFCVLARDIEAPALYKVGTDAQ